MSSLHEHILVVEDDTQIRNFICFTLEAEAYVCHTAATAEEAMRLLAAEPVGRPEPAGFGVGKARRYAARY